jgi:hypothetical protein
MIMMMPMYRSTKMSVMVARLSPVDLCRLSTQLAGASQNRKCTPRFGGKKLAIESALLDLAGRRSGNRKCTRRFGGKKSAIERSALVDLAGRTAIEIDLADLQFVARSAGLTHRS